jgi:hypothetical protein
MSSSEPSSASRSISTPGSMGRERLDLGSGLCRLDDSVFFYSIHIYPEIFVAAAGLYVFRGCVRLVPDNGDYVLSVLIARRWFPALNSLHPGPAGPLRLRRL